MLFPDLSLARRLESHEAWSSGEHARTQARLYPETGAVSEPLGNGCLVYCGVKSPLSQVYAWGLSGPVSAEELDRIEAFYRRRGLRPRVRVCPLADPSLLPLLGERRYIVQDRMNVYALPMVAQPIVAQEIVAQEDASTTLPDVDIRIATPEEAKLWFELDGAGGDWAEPDGLAFMVIRCTLKSDTRLFLAWRDGQPASGGALETHNGVAALMAAGTRPPFRNQGLHTAVLRARLAHAVEAGCDLAMVQTRPGAASQRNVLRSGFQLVYTVDTMAPSS